MISCRLDLLPEPSLFEPGDKFLRAFFLVFYHDIRFNTWSIFKMLNNEIPAIARREACPRTLTAAPATTGLSPRPCFLIDAAPQIAPAISPPRWAALSMIAKPTRPITPIKQMLMTMDLKNFLGRISF